MKERKNGRKNDRKNEWKKGRKKVENAGGNRKEKNYKNEYK